MVYVENIVFSKNPRVNSMGIFVVSFKSCTGSSVKADVDSKVPVSKI